MHDLGLIHVVGTMTKEDKNNYISKLPSENLNPHYNIKVLCATIGVGNAGIDYPNVRVVYLIDIDPYLFCITQEKGRAGRQDEALPNYYKYIMCFSIGTYIQLYRRIWGMSEHILDPGYRFHNLDDLNKVSIMLLGQDCFHKVLEIAMDNYA